MLHYMISISGKDPISAGTIHDPQTKLKVKAFDVLNPGFGQAQGELRYFVTSGKETLAFETEGYKRHRQLLVLQMISRYCVYLGLDEAKIHSTLPNKLRQQSKYGLTGII